MFTSTRLWRGFVAVVIMLSFVLVWAPGAYAPPVPTQPQLPPQDSGKNNTGLYVGIAVGILALWLVWGEDLPAAFNWAPPAGPGAW